MNNQKGLTLIEVLGSVALLGVAVLAITYLLQQATIHTKGNQKIDQSVQITRTAMEEVKNNLSASSSFLLFDQTVNTNSSVTTVRYPKNDSRYELVIHIGDANLDDVTISKEDYELHYDLNDIFKLVRIDCKDLQTNKHYSLESYVEYN